MTECAESEFKYPQWQRPLMQAILDRRRLPEVENVIRERLGSLMDSEFSNEQQALIDALATIRVLK
jgi:hypothetical protein